MKKTLWPVSACLIALLCCGYAGCTEQPPDARGLPAQDVCSEEEPGDRSHYPKEEAALVSRFQSPFEDGPPTDREPKNEELMKRDSGDDKQQAEGRALEVEELAEEVEPEPVNESEPEPEWQPELLLPEASITQDREPSPAFGPSPPPSGPSPPPSGPSPPPSGPSPPPSGPASPTAQDSLSPDTVSEQVETDVDSGDCDLSSVPVVLENTSNVHSGGTKTHVDPALTQPGQGAPGLGQGANTSHMLDEQGFSSHVSAEIDPGVAAKDPEDIPTFDEWKRKVMEVEKEKTQAVHTSSNSGPHLVKKVQKKNFNNYASVECGAKILGANPEAKSTSAILMENMDLYMLNPCSNKIWFIIELCEPIQVKQLDIANFELFSSTPKDFLVSISDRYPTNKWLKLGTFHGRDERTVQSFPLDEHLYAKYVKMFTKYIKVELLSHFGSEHFCPFSLIRVFGTSMVEEYEEISDPSERADEQDDYFDYPPGYVPPPEDRSSNNLIGSAKDVILNMVNNIAVNVLGGGPGSEGNFTGPVLNMTEMLTSSQLDATPTLSLAPETVGGDQADIQEDRDAALTEVLATEPPILELHPSTDAPRLELPHAEHQDVTPPEQEKEQEEEDDYPPVILLDREEEEEEEEEERQRMMQESLDYGGGQSTSSASSRCCSASLQEYLQQRCSARALTPARGADGVPQTPQQQPRDPPAAPPDPPQPPADREEPGPDPLQLEPSQTSSSLAGPSSSQSPASRPTPAAVEPPYRHTHSTPDPRPLPERSQEAQAALWETGPTPTVGGSALATTRTGGVPTDRVWEPPAAEEKPGPEADLLPEPPAPTARTPEVAEPPPSPLPTVSPATERPVPPPAEPDGGGGGGTDAPDESRSDSEVAVPPNGHGASAETKAEELADDILFTSSNGDGQLPRPSSSSSSSSHATSQSDFYAELQNGTEQGNGNGNGNGNQVHGSSQKESVFMRLNNRIKALEMNMSLSGRYLEQLSQRYRKQMEEMQRAFNKTVIKLQNTSRIAEEQDQRQTESIQMLHGQLQNITRLVLNLTIRVSQLQNEVSDRQSYLMLCLVLGVLLALLLCAQHCRMSALPPSSDPESPTPKSYSYCCPDRPFPSYDDTSLKRSASYPLLNSAAEGPESLGPESLHTVEPHRLHRKKKRGRTKPKEKADSSAVVSAPPLANGAPLSNGAPRGMDPTAAGGPSRPPVLRDAPSEGSSEGSSSHSDEPSFCGIATSCTRLCEGPPPPRSRAEKRAFKRRRSKTAVCVVADLAQAPRRERSDEALVPLLQDHMAGNKELSSGTFGVKALSGPV